MLTQLTLNKKMSCTALRYQLYIIQCILNVTYSYHCCIFHSQSCICTVLSVNNVSLSSQSAGVSQRLKAGVILQPHRSGTRCWLGFQLVVTEYLCMSFTWLPGVLRAWWLSSKDKLPRGPGSKLKKVEKLLWLSLGSLIASFLM